MPAQQALPVAVELGPIGPRRVQHNEGTDDVGVDERRRAVDGAVDVALGREVHDGVRPMGGEDVAHGGRVGDVGAEQLMPLMVSRLLERVLGCGVGHLVHVHDLMVGAADQVAYDGRADEAAAAGDDYPHDRSDILFVVTPWQDGSLAGARQCMSRSRQHATIQDERQ